MHRKNFVRGLPTLAFHGINSNSARKLPAHRRGMHRKNFVHRLLTLAFHGINSDSAGNYQLMEADSDRQDQNVRKILKAVTISGSASSNPIYCEGQLFKKFKYENVIKIKNKPDPALVGGSYLFNEIKKDTKISWNYPFK
jgi:hypothetical protein